MNCPGDQCSTSAWKFNIKPEAAAIFDCENDVYAFCLKLASATLHTATEFVVARQSSIIFSVVSVLFVYVIYKSYWSPISIERELTDYGFEHITKGPNRDIRIAREMRSRRVGEEIPPPYPNGWFAVAESRFLKRGGVTAVSALGHNFCVYRGEDGIARCVDAYCPHLGANLGVGGRVEGNCIECPFHMWRFGDSGECVSVQGLDNPPRGVYLKTWTAKEANGAVWVWHDAEGRSPLWPMEPYEETKSWGYRGRNEFIVGSHVMDIPENGADAAHFNSVHGPSLLTTQGNKYPFLSDYIGRHDWVVDWIAPTGQPAKMNIYHKYKLGKYSFFPMEFNVDEIYPGSAHVYFKCIIGRVLILQSVTPIGPLQQRVVHRFYSPWYNAPFATALVFGEIKMFERDIRIWNHKQYQRAPAYGRTDKWIKSFRAWFMQFYSENSVSYKDATRNNLDW